jgi:hypothetical protein
LSYNNIRMEGATFVACIRHLLYEKEYAQVVLVDMGIVCTYHTKTERNVNNSAIAYLGGIPVAFASFCPLWS